MKLYLFNTLSKSKEIFIPHDMENIGMYVCGPTVYDFPHLGNALAVVIYDVLYRLLINIYGKEKITYVRNITDVDDKIINAAYEKKISVQEITDNITKIYQSNMSELNCLDPNFQPRATEHIQEMIDMIQKLIDKGYAYEKEGHVYFRVNKYNKYSYLSGRKIDELIAGARIEVNITKENPEDFVLWKPAKDIDHSFISPFGIGRPGWHIECSAMSFKYLGADFDIHGGGIDLVFPHHTNEIAQSCCAHDNSNYAKYWVHNGFLTVEGEKMSKSLGNFITVQELLDQGIEGEAIRYVLLSSHYRSPLDWNKKILEDAKKSLDSFYRVIGDADDDNSVTNEFMISLSDDLNTPKCFAILHEYTRLYNSSKTQREKNKFANQLKSCGKLLGFFNKSPEEWFTTTSIDKNYIEEMISKRLVAKKSKNWVLADSIRDELKSQNIILEDLQNGEVKWRKT